MKSLRVPMVLIALSLLLNSCAAIINGKYQKVNYQTKSKDSKVFVNGEEQAQGQNVKLKLRRNGVPQQIRVETEGYKDEYAVIAQTKKSPFTLLSIPFFVPLLFDFGSSSNDFNKNWVMSKDLLAIPKKKENQKYLFVEKTTFDLAEQDLKFSRIAYRHDKKNRKGKLKEIDSNEEEIKFDNSIFTESLNDILIEYGYTDSTNTIFKSKNSSAYLSAKINKLDLQYVVSNSAFSAMQFYRVVVDIEWDLLDIYGQSLYKRSFESGSGDFSSFHFGQKLGRVAIEDAISHALLNFINDEKVQDILGQDIANSEEYRNWITLSKGNIVENLDEAIQATVTVQTQEGHGSGFMISNDGYILTNFHVVATQEDDITIITHDNTKLRAEVVRQSEEFDLALLKVDSSFEKHFKLPVDKNYSTGQDVFVVGTPERIELGQTLTKGIISGYRESENTKLIQTDASINGGNSGGPLISPKGELLGVVNAKFSGFGVEGIGFAIPASIISAALSIK